MTRFVQRDRLGAIIGHYANRQPGYAEEEIKDDDPALVAFNAGALAALIGRDPLAEIDTLRAELAAMTATKTTTATAPKVPK